MTDPRNLPCDTEYHYKHTFRPHPFLPTGFMLPPIEPGEAKDVILPLAELDVRNDKMTPIPRSGPPPTPIGPPRGRAAAPSRRGRRANR